VKLSFWGLGLLSVLPVLAPTLAHASCDAANLPTADYVRSVIKTAIAPHVHVLKRHVYFYSWNAHDPGTSAKDDFVAYSGKNEGIFSAADPISSISFGGQDGTGVLMRIGVPAGVAYLDDGDMLSLPGFPSFLIDRSAFSVSQEDLDRMTCFYSSSPENASTLKQIIKDLRASYGIAFSLNSWERSPFRDCANYTMANAEIIFSDPSVANNLELSFLKGSITAIPADQKDAYREVLNFFEVFDFQKDFTGNDIKESFWPFYRDWAPLVDGAPADTLGDLAIFRKQRFKELLPTRSQLLENTFGCSSSPENADEVPAAVVSPSTIATLVQHLSDGDYEAENALGRTGKKATAALIEALSSSNPVVRSQAAYALGQTYDPSAIPALTAKLTDPNAEVRSAAQEALRLINHEQ
jgi:hypothetical protein